MKFTDRLTRQLDLIPLDNLGQRITIIGAGAVGSFAALTLAKMGFYNIGVWDNDSIEVENMNCQFYRTSDIGVDKVVALNELVRDFTDVNIDPRRELWDKSKPITGIVIMAVDKMDVRAELWAYCKQAIGIPYVIDTRMGGESILMYSMNMKEDNSSYETTLYTDDNAHQERCTAKATMYTVNLIAGLIGKCVKDIVTNNKRTKTIMWDVKANVSEMFLSKEEE